VISFVSGCMFSFLCCVCLVSFVLSLFVVGVFWCYWDVAYDRDAGNSIRV